MAAAAASLGNSATSPIKAPFVLKRQCIRKQHSRKSPVSRTRVVPRPGGQNCRPGGHARLPGAGRPAGRSAKTAAAGGNWATRGRGVGKPPGVCARGRSPHTPLKE